jgi:tRNA-dihydrouridine synthase B
VVSIGPYRLRNNVLLAPMAGITDAPFRELAWRFGAGYVVGEMVSASEQLWHTAKSRLRRVRVANVEPFAVQIAGGDAQTVADSAVRHCQEGAQIIDINFGCPAKKVCRKLAGSQLLKDSDLVEEIARATVRAVAVPVTVKMRTGWSPDMNNALEIATRLEAAGVAAIVVHGRTRACRFRGSAEHDTVAQIKSRLSIPIFANGDIDSLESARRVIDQTGVDGVMIGRGALGRPWLLGDIAQGRPDERTFAEKRTVMIEHVQALHEFYGEAGIRIARKHVQWYLQHLVEAGAEKSRSQLCKGFNQLQQAEAQLNFLGEVDVSADSLGHRLKGGRIAA